ncbi:MAG TPA: class I SAM-dependent rRNA methyltransferase [Polyangiaceae bacterium]|nr:class I SAM-dependent rRNA methyltransferase [Polyangiaceae bacterium]
MLRLPSSLAESLELGHPWVYRNHVPAGIELRSGTVVQVQCGAFQGYALWDETSPIALRILSRGTQPDRAWLRERLLEALALRASVLSHETTAARIVFGEGDGIPGLSVDLYDKFAVIITYADALDRFVADVAAILTEELALEGVLLRNRELQEGEGKVKLLSGRAAPERLIVREHGVKLWVELYAGQKTGMFLDHRENRAYVRGIAAGKRVLNLFSYTGAFSVNAALGGATQVISVDIASGALHAAAENFTLNEVPRDLHQEIAQDVFEYLNSQRAAPTFDLVICDPPSFASSQKQKFAALRAYQRLNALGLSVVQPGGLYAAASCTAQVSPEDFRYVLSESAARAGVRFQIIHEAGQPQDHPIGIGHPEGRYLKFVVGRVLRHC